MVRETMPADYRVRRFCELIQCEQLRNELRFFDFFGTNFLELSARSRCTLRRPFHVPGLAKTEIFVNVSIFCVCVRRFSPNKAPVNREISASTYSKNISKFDNSSGARSYDLSKMPKIH